MVAHFVEAEAQVASLSTGIMKHPPAASGIGLNSWAWPHQFTKEATSKGRHPGEPELLERELEDRGLPAASRAWAHGTKVGPAHQASAIGRTEVTKLGTVTSPTRARSPGGPRRPRGASFFDGHPLNTLRGLSFFVSVFAQEVTSQRAKEPHDRRHLLIVIPSYNQEQCTRYDEDGPEDSQYGFCGWLRAPHKAGANQDHKEAKYEHTGAHGHGVLCRPPALARIRG